MFADTLNNVDEVNSSRFLCKLNINFKSNEKSITIFRSIATTFANSYEQGTAITEESVKSGAPLVGFDTNIWKFKQGEYPSLKALSNDTDDELDEYGSISYWNGIDSDTSWFNEKSTTYHLNDAAQLKGLADIVNNGTASESSGNLDDCFLRLHRLAAVGVVCSQLRVSLYGYPAFLLFVQ